MDESKHDYYLDAIKSNGWFPEGDFYEYLTSRGYSIERGEHDNRTDGEAHWIITSPNGNAFIMHTNRWSAKTYKDVVEWVFGTEMQRNA